MARKKTVKLHNRSDKPDNVILRQRETEDKCEEIQRKLPSFMRGFFAYLKGNVLPLTRLNYLHDIRFFCRYLISETDLTSAEKMKDIKLTEFQKIQAVDINIFIERQSAEASRLIVKLQVGVFQHMKQLQLYAVAPFSRVTDAFQHHLTCLSRQAEDNMGDHIDPVFSQNADRPVVIGQRITATDIGSRRRMDRLQAEL